MPKAKKFIDRKSAVTFNLVHRSQRDPLAADDTAPQRVLVPVSANVPETSHKQPKLTPEQRRSVQQKYGIYFDDDYNYLQHLRDTKEVTMLLQPKALHKRKEKSSEPTQDQDSAIEQLQLPSSVFASQVEEDVGLLNKAAPQGLCLDLDPDVVAALDEDFDYDNPDNELEDNFMELAMAEGSEDESDEESEAGSDQAFESDQEYDSNDSQESNERMPNWDKFGADETKSRFSQYSMSSSVMRRNQGLDLLDHRFEKMFAEYDDTELGALDCEEIEGTLPASHEDLLRAAEEFQAQRASRKIDKERETARMTRMQEIAEESSEEESSEEEMARVEVEQKEKWDCESILTTYSNLYNRPQLIEEPKKPSKIKINARTGIPIDIHTSNKLTAKSLARFNAETARSSSEDDAHTHAESVVSTLSVLSIRPRDETQEEKKERKRLLKEYRKGRRLEKKANKEVFKEEKKRQEKILLNNKSNVQGNRIL